MSRKCFSAFVAIVCDVFVCRQMVARNLLETIRSGEPNAENATKVLEAMAQLAEDQGAFSVVCYRSHSLLPAVVFNAMLIMDVIV